MKTITKIKLALSATVVLAIAIGICYHRDSEDRLRRRQEKAEPELVRYYGPRFRYGAEFNDLQDKHIKAAKKHGLKEVPDTRESVENMSGKLDKIETCPDYKVMNLTNSVPYLRPYAAKELKRIGRAFRDSLEAKGLPQYRIIVTSVLRTQEDVKELRRVNGNASANSAHEYGTTFDIWYAHYDWREYKRSMDQSDLRVVLAEVLKAEQKEERIFVKYESKQHCFHITARK
ncbi:MAG: DUF5715 family protein [Bacteroidales bacterium]|nr:DUF5715 family protein [Bacteroidales bacterium]